MSVFDFDEEALRSLIADEVRRAIREELRAKPAGPGDFISVGEAANTASVTPQTIRVWLQQRRLKTYKAGRELRVRRSELLELLAVGTTPSDGAQAERSPERLADQAFERQRQKAHGRPKHLVHAEADAANDESFPADRARDRGTRGPASVRLSRATASPPCDVAESALNDRAIHSKNGE